MDQYTISPDELKRRLDARKVEFIFDLRNAEEFAGWRIEGKTDVETLNIPKADFVGEEDSHVGRLPRDRAILTVCAHGDASRYAAEQLRERGFSALSLEGGMERWSELYETRRVRTDPDIHQIFRTARGCITHLVVSGNEAVVIDAVRHIDRILDLAASSGARITHVFDTHLQADHISGGRDIANKTGALYHLHPADADGATYPFSPLADGEVIQFGTSRLKAVHGPGHTPGSTALLLDDAVLFTGDTVMKTGIGRPDLGGMAEPWARLLFDTLFTRFAVFKDTLLVLPTHAASVREQDSGGIVAFTLGEARQQSDLFQIRNFPDFLERVVASLPENPERYQDIRKVNLGLLEPDEARRRELEIGKNLCSMAQAG